MFLALLQLVHAISCQALILAQKVDGPLPDTYLPAQDITLQKQLLFQSHFQLALQNVNIILTP